MIEVDSLKLPAILVVDSSFLLENALISENQMDTMKMEKRFDLMRRIEKKEGISVKIRGNIRDELSKRLPKNPNQYEEASIQKIRDYLFNSDPGLSKTRLDASLPIVGLSKMLRGVGEELAIRRDKPLLSKADLDIGAYALAKILDRDVIFASRDQTLLDSVAYTFSASRDIRVDHGFPDTQLYFMRNIEELEHLERELITYYKLALFHKRRSKKPLVWVNNEAARRVWLYK